MRPIELKMQAFGPYRDKIHLDFTKFGNHSIFLINGPTGSGKTTIFDAISYALFNEPSGQNRNPDMMKSDFATDEDFAEVELIFEMNNKNYRIVRSPQQKGPGERVKVRDHPASVEFYREEELLGTGRDATDQIVNLLGLTYNQFRQIVLLPQGEFRQLLISNSREKEEIFRNIFGTQAIEDFQEDLKMKRAAYQEQYKEYETRLEQNIEALNLKQLKAKDEETINQLAKAIERRDYQKILVILEKILSYEQENLKSFNCQLKDLEQEEESYREFKKLLKEQGKLEKRREQLLVQLTNIEESKIKLDQNKKARILEEESKELELLKKELKTTEETIEEKSTQENELKKHIQNLKLKEKDSIKDEEKLDSLRATVSSIEFDLKKFKEIKEVKKIIRKSEDNLEKIVKKLKTQITDKEQFTKEIEKLKEELKKINPWRKNLAKNRETRERLNVKLQEQRKRKDRLAKIITLQKELKKLLKENKESYESYQVHEKIYQEARQDYFNNLAGILSKDLIKESPCPVCGSIEHPEPADHQESYQSKERLEELERKKDQAKSADQKITHEINKVTESINEEFNLMEDLAIEQLKEQKIQANFEKILLEIKDLEAEIKALTEKMVSIEANLEQEDGWRDLLDKLQEKLNQAHVTIAASQKDQSNEKRKIEENKKQVKQIRAELAADSIVELEAKRTDLEKEIQGIVRKSKEIQKSLNSAATERAAIESSLEHLYQEAEKLARLSKNQKDTLKKLFKKHKLEDNFSTFILNDKKIKELEAEIKTFEAENEYTRRQLKKTKADLENFENMDKQSLVEIKRYLLEMIEKKEKLNNKRDEILQNHSKNKNTYREIKANFEESESIQRPLKIYSELAEIARGTSKRTNYVSFERYLLSIYFSEILTAANERFITMTNSRYELVRREEKTKGRGAEGLEIDVLDRYSGKERSVKSLSGGETFKASLALALGLSDVIQSQKGGVEINTLFIDEGFGTLDTDSLEMAIETLINLQSSGRLIGVISHVDELKDRIPARMIVENMKEGSHVHIEID